MSAPGTDRLLLFELGGHVYGLPITGIVEVVEADEACGVPTLPTALAGVMNWHGEALPVVAPTALVADGAVRGDEGVAGAVLRAGQVLVLSDRAGEAPQLGLPIDSVLGLSDAPASSHVSTGSSVVLERRSVDGRVVSVLDPRRLVARARNVIEDMAA